MTEAMLRNPETMDADPDVPVAEIAARTRFEESRAAMAVVSGLLERDVAIRDIVVVARDLEKYEDPLSRAAIQYGIAPAVWTQIQLENTRIFTLVHSLCELFAADQVSREELFHPLEIGWVPQSPSEYWPLSLGTVLEEFSETKTEKRSLQSWADVFTAAEGRDPRVAEYVNWVAKHPNPTPNAIEDILGDLVRRYREHVLPAVKASDSPALLETETAARATVRMKTLVGQVQAKYTQRLKERWTQPSWQAVSGIMESIAQQRPGRREHANARAVDIVEANDMLARHVPFVIAVGLQDGEWPRQPDSVLPAEFRVSVVSGASPARQLSPRLAWQEGRDYDQFYETVQAATQGLVVTRYVQDQDGLGKTRSPLLAALDVEEIPQAARKQLLNCETELPAPIEAMISNQPEESPSENSD